MEGGLDMTVEDIEFLLFLQDISDEYSKQVYSRTKPILITGQPKLPDKYVATPVSTYVAMNRYKIDSISEMVDHQLNRNKDVTPWNVGVEWLTGNGPRDRVFKDGDYFTELLKKHGFIDEIRNEIIRDINNKIKNIHANQRLTEQLGYTGPDYDSLEDIEKLYVSASTSYSLQGWEGVGKYIKDYSTLLTLGYTGNLAVTYLGTYNISWKVISIDFIKSTVIVSFKVYNSSTMASGTRPPVLGYTEWYLNNVQPKVNDFFSSGWGSKTTQTFIWQETLKLN